MLKKNATIVVTIALLLSVLFINLISLHKFIRIDLTKEKKYTLSPASVKTMQGLEDVMSLTAYFTDGLPMPYASYPRYVQDLLEEYRSVSLDKLSFEFLDPMYEETASDKVKKKEATRDVFGRLVREPTSVESELMEIGIEPVEIRMIEDDQQQTKRAYMGIVIHYQGKQEVIPVVQNLLDLEKEITLLMRKLIRKKLPIVALVSDVPHASLSKWIHLASQSAVIKEVQFTQNAEELNEVDALIIAGNPKKLSKNILVKIDEFVRAGKGVALLIDRFGIDTQTFQAYQEEESVLFPVWDWLSSYGVVMGYDLVADANCAHINLNEEQDGMLLNVPIRYPFIPEISVLDQDSLLTRGLTGVMLPFVASLQLKNSAHIQTVALASSSKNSWVEIAPINTNPKRDWGDGQLSVTGPHVLVAQVKNKAMQSNEKNWRLLVSGTSSFLWDFFLSGSSQALALNLVDWLLADEELLAMRNRALVDLPINSDLSDETKALLKYGNIFGAPLLLLLYGLVRRSLREKRRKRFL